jgi:hypothetical protein
MAGLNIKALLALSQAHWRAQQVLAGATAPAAPTAEAAAPAATGPIARVLAFYWGPADGARARVLAEARALFPGHAVRTLDRADVAHLGEVVRYKVTDPNCLIGLDRARRVVARVRVEQEL